MNIGSPRIFVHPSCWDMLMYEARRDGREISTGPHGWCIDDVPVVIDDRADPGLKSVTLYGPAPWEVTAADAPSILDSRTGESP